MFTKFDLQAPLLKAVERLGFEHATSVQEQAIPPALEAKDIMVCAQTGSGKSAAFLLPMLNHLITQAAPNSKTRALVLVPTRELARQLLKQTETLAKFSRIQAAMITGGQEFKFQAALLRKNPEIIIATPGRLLEHIGKSEGLMEDVEILVLDEADRMLDMGFSEDVLKIAGQCSLANRQTMMFSATLKQRGMRDIIATVLNNPQNILVDDFKGEHENISQEVMLADNDKHKQRLLTWLLANKSHRQAIVFVNTKIKAESLYHFLDYHSINAAVLQGDMTQDERNYVMQRMKQGSVDVLVATDVAARGLDVKQIDLVINFDMPRSGDDYVHRIGRTGRAGEQGLAVSLVEHTEWNLKCAIERYLRIEMTPKKAKGLEGTYKGPKKMKSNGKPVGKKPPKKKDAKKVSAKKSPKKSTKPAPKKPATPRLGDGSAPFKPKRSS
ncbi:DEAD/DEAH box helicase [Oceaniserpentilla sp. 4NH20-0058]|uniref:DEAD/DEAH box helicase n=1 Tax=Oceaniserpentilla sp. 4NH20-0058 TaxID=3127660 RepID=UPI003104CAD3